MVGLGAKSFEKREFVLELIGIGLAPEVPGRKDSEVQQCLAN